MADDLQTAVEKLNEATAAARAGAEPGTDIVSTGAGDAQQAKRDLERVRQDAAAKAEEVRRAIEAVREEAEAMVRAAREELAPLEERMEVLREGLWTVDLYLGRNEEIKALRAKGKTAPADSPVTVRQQVLAMDEECAVKAEEGGIDPVEIYEFDQWLLEDPSHVQQVIPGPKGVVALVPRAHAKSYEDPWMAASMNKENKKTYFLIRNGERLHRTVTDFYAGKRLVPGPDEFTRFFEYESGRGSAKVRKPLTPGSRKWLDAEKEADERQRHYMRIALILEGLVHRTPLFHPLPEWGISFIDQAAHRQGRVRFIMDGDEGKLPSGHESYKDWRTRLGNQLRPGLRIMIARGGYRDGLAQYNYERRQGNERINPNSAKFPPTNEPLLLERARSGGIKGEMVVRYERTGERIYDYWGSREPKNRASCVIKHEDEWVLPYDLAEVEDMERFLITRGDRHNYTEMFPTLKAAIAAKKAEAKEEEPFAEMLAGVLMRDHDASPDAAEAAVPELIKWWKLKNRYHRPLVGKGDDQAKAVKEISVEYGKRFVARPDDDQELVDRLASNQATVHIARKNDGVYVHYERERPTQNVFLRVTEYTKTGKPREPARWRIWTPAMDGYRVLHTTTAWRDWDRKAVAAEHFTDEEVEAAVELAKAQYGKQLVAVTIPPDYRHQEVYEDSYHWRPIRAFAITIWQRHKGDLDWDHLDGTTEKLYAPAIQARDLRVHRRKDGQIRLDSDEYSSNWGEVSWGKGHGIAARDTDKRPWDEEGYGRNRRKVLFLDQRKVRALDTAWEKYEAARDARDAAAERAWPAKDSLERAWLDRADQQRFKEFMDEYGDESLWEGHRKTLKDLSAPRSLRKGEILIQRAYDADLDPHGMTVKALAEAAKKAGIKVPELDNELLDLEIDATPPAGVCPYCGHVMRNKRKKCPKCGEAYSEEFTVDL